jgi:hypothetical protein
LWYANLTAQLIFAQFPKVVFRFWLLKEKLEDVKWLSEAIYLGTDNTMIQDNRQTMIYTTLNRKLEIEQSKSHKNERVRSSCSTRGNHRVKVKPQEHHQLCKTPVYVNKCK